MRLKSGIARLCVAALLATPSWAWQMNCVHSFGIALNIAFVRFDQENIEFAAQTPVSIDPTRFTNRGANWQEGVSIRFGWIGQYFDCLRLGMTYQTKTYMGHFNKYTGFIPDRGSLDLPSQFGFGVAYHPSCDVVVTAEVVKLFWRDGKWFRNILTSLPIANSNRFGANNGPGLDWSDQLIFKIGGAWDIWDCLTLRMGFNYGNAPPSMGNALGVLMPEAVTQHFTFGGTYVWNCWNELTINYVHGRNHTISGQLDPPDFNQVTGSTWRMWDRSFGVAYSRLF